MWAVAANRTCLNKLWFHAHASACSGCLITHVAVYSLGRCPTSKLLLRCLHPVLLFRHPDDLQQILTKDNLFRKSQRVAQSQEWLGTGLFSQLDYNKHAAMRQTLNPAFRMEYLKQLDMFFLVSASQLADALKKYAATATPKTSDTISDHSINTALEMQKVFRLCTLDSIGLTSMKHNFKALSSWQQQQQGSNSSKSESNQTSSGADIDQMLTDLSTAFAWQSLVLPVPRSWLPGWGPYITACRKLDVVWRDILQERREALHPATEAGQKQDLLGFLLQAQQKQGSEVITDEMIGDEVKTMIFAGSDTSSFTMSMVCCLTQLIARMCCCVAPQSPMTGPLLASC
eukprot:GHUV01036703.1.p1 GENE.GHUV01036703.1~~GHUV01036703.1.p1  ORF type:complete len:344 (+),score=98.37 GHUV01036703.1:129-1160(+)